MTMENSALAAPGGGVIHDIGYRHYTGPRLGRAGIVRALIWHSLRSSVGIGRGAKAKIIPVIAFVAMCLPAVANAVRWPRAATGWSPTTPTCSSSACW